MISEREKTFLIYWEARRKSGRLLYSFKHGAVMFAWPVYLVTEVFRYFTTQGDYSFNALRFIQGFLIWSMLGFIAFGTVMWWTHEKQYRLIRKKESA